MRSIGYNTVITNMSTTLQNFNTPTLGNNSWSTTEAQRRQLIPCAGVIKRWDVLTTTSPGAGKSYTYEIYVNGAASGYTCAVTDTNTFAQNDLELVVAAGDDLSISCTPAGTPSLTVVRWAFIFEATAFGDIPFICGHNQTFQSTTPLYAGMYGGCAWAASAAGINKQVMVPVSGTVKNLYVKLSAAPGATVTWNFTVRKNKTNQSLAVSISGTNTSGNDLSNSFTVAAGDLIDIEFAVGAGTPLTAARATWGVVFRPDSQVLAPQCGGTDSLADDAAATNYNALANAQSGFTTIIANRRNILPLNARISNLFVQLDTAPSSGSWDGEIFHNNALTALEIQTITTTALQSNVTTVISATDQLTTVFNLDSNTAVNDTAAGWGVAVQPYVPGLGSRSMMGVGI